MRVALCLLQCASLASLVSLSFSACTVTDTIKGALGSTSDFLSSTTPGSWVTADGLLKPEHKVTAFVTLNFENLKQDMAQGQAGLVAHLLAMVVQLAARLQLPVLLRAEFLEVFPQSHRPEGQVLVLDGCHGLPSVLLGLLPLRQALLDAPQDRVLLVI